MRARGLCGLCIISGSHIFPATTTAHTPPFPSYMSKVALPSTPQSQCYAAGVGAHNCIGGLRLGGTIAASDQCHLTQYGPSARELP
jgi:hypothetical protein